MKLLLRNAPVNLISRCVLFCLTSLMQSVPIHHHKISFASKGGISMSNVINLMLGEVSDLGSKLKWIETDVVKVRDLVSMVIRSVETNEDESLKTVLRIASEDLDSILINDVYELNKVITKIEKLSETEVAKPKQRRRTVKKDDKSGEDVKKSRNKKKDNVVDIVDAVIEQAVSE